MRGLRCLVQVSIWIAAMSLPLAPLAAQQPAAGPMERLQKLAEHQGHPAAAVTQLENFGFEVTPEMEAAAMGIQPEDVKAAARKGGSIETRLEALLRRPLTAEQKRRIADAGREFSQNLETPRKEYVESVSRATGLSLAQTTPIVLPKGKQDPTVDIPAVAKLEKLLGRKLIARELDQIRGADRQKRSAGRVASRGLCPADRGGDRDPGEVRPGTAAVAPRARRGKARGVQAGRPAHGFAIRASLVEMP